MQTGRAGRSAVGPPRNRQSSASSMPTVQPCMVVRRTFVDSVGRPPLCATAQHRPAAKRPREHFGVGRRKVAVDETVILLHRPLPLVGVSIVMKRKRQQNDSLVNGRREGFAPVGASALRALAEPSPPWRATRKAGSTGQSAIRRSWCSITYQPPDWRRPIEAIDVCPPELKVMTPAHTKQLGWYAEFESRVTHP